jgi:endoglucanase
VTSAIRRDAVVRLARRTLACPTAPFREGAVIAWIREFAAARPWLALREDRDGNLELRRARVRRSPSPLVLAAHMDHPGFRVRGSRWRRPGWRVAAELLGGVAPELLPGARVRLHFGGRAVRARIVGVGGGSPRRVELEAPAPVPRGAFGTFDLPDFRRSARDPDRIHTRAADDLAGVAAILALLDAVERIDPRRRADVRGVFTRGEEVGFAGALAIARRRGLPRAARIVAIEASKALPNAPVGGGPILRVGDRTSVFDDGLTRWLARVAADLPFPWRRRLMDGGTCESTAYQLHGYRCAALCLPLGNYHNGSERGRIAAEVISLADLVGLARFFEALVRDDAGARRARRDPLRARLDLRAREHRRELARNPFA